MGMGTGARAVPGKFLTVNEDYGVKYCFLQSYWTGLVTEQ